MEIKRVELYQKKSTASKRGIGKRKCERCQRWHKPLSVSVKFCGACSARLLASVSWRGLWR